MTDAEMYVGDRRGEVDDRRSGGKHDQKAQNSERRDSERRDSERRDSERLGSGWVLG